MKIYTSSYSNYSLARFVGKDLWVLVRLGSFFREVDKRHFDDEFECSSWIRLVSTEPNSWGKTMYRFNCVAALSMADPELFITTYASDLKRLETTIYYASDNNIELVDPISAVTTEELFGEIGPDVEDII